MTYKPALMLVPFAMMVSTPMRADVTFNITYDSSMSAFGSQLSNLETATQDVANEYSHLFSNNVTVNIVVKADSNPASLGASLATFTDSTGLTFTYAQIKAALQSHASTAASISAENSLSAIDPTGGGTFDLPTADAKALGLIPGNGTTLDGTFFIGSANTYTFDPNNRAVPGAFDYIGTAEHEFSEIMGRISGLNVGGVGYVPFDLFRFTGNGVRSLDPNATGVYFSTDGGATDLRNYNPPGNGGDIQDWASSQSPVSSYDAFGMPNEKEPIIPVDLTVMNTIGWEANISSVPEPSVAGPLSVLMFGLMGISAVRRQKKSA